MKRFLVLMLLAAAGSALAAGPIVDTEFVAAAAERGAILWDVRHAALYRKGHLPGAVNVGDAAQVLRNPNTEDFIPTADIERILGGAGIDPAKEIVVYAGRGQPTANFALYALEYFGAKRATVYHDGLDGWVAAGRVLSFTPQVLPPVALKLSPREDVAVSTRELLAKSGVQLVDVRTAAEYRGEDIRAIRGGHIPGAVNIPYESNWVDPDTPTKLAARLARDTSGMRLKSEAELRALYAGLDPAKETVVYCQSGVRAAQTAQVLAQLGFRNVKVYDSSWLGYASTLSAPAENEVFFNVGAMNARLGGLQARIEELERAAAEARAKRP